ncbi:MAG: rod shape-determining protein RodA [Candidatus Omnitrophica bacterium]|nr:rod shape-determining protein RodA [Candidatus Omnitrophota bacterium]
MNDAENRPDWALILAPMAIFLIGLFFIYSASRREGQMMDESLVFRQALWMMFSVAVVFFSTRFHYRWLLGAAWPMYAVVMILLVAVFFTPARLGAHRWIRIGFASLQPSEIAKIAVIVILAAVMREKQFGAYSQKRFLIPLALMAAPMVLILKEPDLGTSLLLVPVFMTMAVVAGMKKRWIVIFVLVAGLLSPILYSHLKNYQKQRILTFVNPGRDPLGAGYTIIQSRIAIGSGGLVGKGFLEGSQTQLRFLPERHTDFIFSVIGEEGGFAAAGAVIFLYWLIVHRGYRIARRSSNRFGKLLATGFTTLLATQTIVNISMTMGLLPVVGMPLFGVSYGGSSLLVGMFLIGLLVNIGMRRDPFL